MTPYLPTICILTCMFSIIVIKVLAQDDEDDYETTNPSLISLSNGTYDAICVYPTSVGPAPFFENDTSALLTILGSACLIAVPLITWSDTLRKLGERFKSSKDQTSKDDESDNDTAGHTIVIYWSFLVLIGYFCVWHHTVWGQNKETKETDVFRPNMSQVTCSKSPSAQKDGKYSAIDDAFINEYGCSNPCDQIHAPSIFREEKDLQLLSNSQCHLWMDESQIPNKNTRPKMRTPVRIEVWMHQSSLIVLPIVVFQGIIAALSNRRSPREIRDYIYLTLARKSSSNVNLSPNKWLLMILEWDAVILAGGTYLLAVLTVIVCPLLLVAHIITFEVARWTTIPDADSMSAVGQWAPWVIVGQAMLVALLSKRDLVIQQLEKESTYSKLGSGTQSTVDSPSTDAEEFEGKNQTTYSTSQELRPNQSEHSHEESKANQSGVLKKTLIDPIIEFYRHVLDEYKNFARWCKDPETTSLEKSKDSSLEPLSRVEAHEGHE
ncbi:uncharacterized protein KY384_002798 [Bacidia gigantensis]|uniref:uncharacterized protein n=1 Tax=Bacidia gigantensis TaxID=2732470 RepID=UPI001D04DB9D|nr:uncharacterized protein KY384_002798 [Bacidia gigantensis]KAG8532920.1 hypothetical protein KY384_002798 [Bacidia gigantensis]